jgi:hypothetical protein
LLHRGIFQDRRAVLTVEKFIDKGPTDIVLINRPKRSWNETPQQSKIPWGVRITRNDAGAKSIEEQPFQARRHISLTSNPGIAMPLSGRTPA